MTINELQEQLQNNLITYLDEMPAELIDGVCQVIVETFNTAFFASKEN
jgi:hypothetical protein